MGGLDVLVNNAGVTRQANFVDITEETYNEMFDLNMRGYFFCAQRAVPLMLARGGGSIINIGSVHGFAGFSGYSAYGATKGAIAAFTRQLAAELAPRKIRVNSLGPGIIEVPRYFDDPEYTTEAGNSAVPIGRVGRPSDIGAAAAFLASDAAEFITGQVFYVDGGSTARLPFSAKEADQLIVATRWRPVACCSCAKGKTCTKQSISCRCRTGWARVRVGTSRNRLSTGWTSKVTPFQGFISKAASWRGSARAFQLACWVSALQVDL